MSGPLEGLKVIEVASWAYVPSAGAVLADWGADVIKVEPPSGDPMRGLTSGNTGRPSDVRQGWEMFNRGKRAISLDLSQPMACEILHELAASADVFLCNFLPPIRKKLKIDDDTIRAINPRIVYGIGSGQGPRGPESDKGGFDLITFWARGGLAAAVTPNDHQPVSLPSGAFGDVLSGMALAGGIAAALTRAARTGKGSTVDGSLLSMAMWAMQMALGSAARSDNAETAPPVTRATTRNPLVSTYRTSDGRWISLCMLQRDRFWEGLFRLFGREDLNSDRRFSTAAARDAHTKEAMEELDKIFGSLSLAECCRLLTQQEGQWDVVRHISELLQDPQAKENSYFQWMEYEDGQRFLLVSNPVQFDQVAPSLNPAPQFSADADDVLQELGWNMDRVINAKIQGAVI